MGAARSILRNVVGVRRGLGRHKEDEGRSLPLRILPWQGSGRRA